MATAGAKVTVASKLPMAIELQLCEFREEQRQNQATRWTENVAHKIGQSVRINGTAYPVVPPPGFRDRPVMAPGGFALTRGVDKEFWDAWVKQNADTAMVKNELIFAHERPETVAKQARDRASLDSGLGPIVPDNDRRLPRPIKGITIEGAAGPTDLDLA